MTSNKSFLGDFSGFRILLRLPADPWNSRTIIRFASPRARRMMTRLGARR